MKKKQLLIVLLAIIAGFVLGYIFKPASPPPSEVHLHQQEETKPKIWTCSMHPQIRLPKPGKCPICFMDLVPVEEEETTTEHPRQLTLSETAKALAEIRTAPVVRKSVINTVRMVGKVEYDETRLSHITAWVPGRIDRLYVDYTGISVRQGDHMVYLYSPELVSTQEELLQTMETEEKLKDTSVKSVLERAISTRQAVEERLLRWGLTAQQIEEIKQRGKTVDHLTIYAPVGGIVIHKDGFEGMYVKTGTRIYTIADLSQLWVFLDAYESDLMWVRYGQEVEFGTEAYPGETFKGRIAFISPFLNEKTRTVKVRLNVPNSDGLLKPGMFVRAEVQAKVAAGGKVVDPHLADKWICPMHPGIVSEGPGKCSRCKMDLVTTKSLGYVSEEDVHEKPLVIPASAPLITGKRAVVYVQVPDADQPTYEGRVVKLGARADEYYIVKSGLQEGEKVVTNGNFKIDSALQIQAKPSMMSPEGGAPVPGHAHHGAQAKPSAKENPPASITPSSPGFQKNDVPEEFRKSLSPLISQYLQTKEALASDNLEKAKASLEHISHVLGSVEMKLLAGETHMRWMKLSNVLESSAQEALNANTINDARLHFAELSHAMIEALKTFRHAESKPLYEFYCSMAFEGKGAFWIQEDEETANPYYGSMMLKCGEKKGEL